MTRMRVTNWPSFATAIACVGVTFAVLFRSVLTEGLTITLLYIAVALILAFTSGFAARDSKGTARVVMWAVMAVATIICVGLSAGRGVAEMDRNAASAILEKKRIKSLEKKLDELDTARQQAKSDRQRAQSKAEADAAAIPEKCKWGQTPICVDARQSQSLSTAALDKANAALSKAEADYYATEQELRDIKPQTGGNSEWRSMARSIAKIFNLDEDRVLEVITQVAPYLLSFLTEIGGIFHLQRAFAPAPSIPPPPKEPDFPPSAAVTIGDIAREIGIEPRIARKLAKERGIKKPAHGQWSWTATEAAQIKLQLSSPATLN